MTGPSQSIARVLALLLILSAAACSKGATTLDDTVNNKGALPDEAADGAAGARAAALCGNGRLDTADGEECDGTNYDDATCETLGFAGGQLHCSAATCRYSTEMCRMRAADGVGTGG
jgi:hypothetical protein